MSFFFHARSADQPPVTPPTPTGKSQLMFLNGLAPAQADLKLSLRLDIYRPNEDGKIPDAQYFAPGKESEHHWLWTEILLVDPKPGAANSANSKFQIRAKVRGLKPLIDKADPLADVLPVRIYRSFVNELDDDESVYESAYTKMFGSAAKDSAGLVKEPAGRRIDLKRIKEIKGDDAVFISDIIDVSADEELNPAKAKLPIPPSVAAFDSDAWFTQWRETMGDEEPDGWAFLQAMKSKGFLSAGLAHPYAKKFAPAKGQPYQFSVSLKDVLHFQTEETGENLIDMAVIQRLKSLPSLARVGEVRDRVKNLGASKVTGRPAANSAFLISTGVQKLVVTAMNGESKGDPLWRFPGIVHTCEGTMDQCLIRAPAQVFYFSGHGWNVSFGGKSFGVINCYSADNPTVFNDKAFLTYATPYLPNDQWGPFAEAPDANRVRLSEKWKKSEVRLQWVYLVGCEALNAGEDPFTKWLSNAGTYGYLIVHELGAKGVLGFGDHGFSSASFMKHYVEIASTTGIAKNWIGQFDDEDARAYTWRETNERFGPSKLKKFADFVRVMPAYSIRKENVDELLKPESMALPAGGATMEFKAGWAVQKAGELKQ